MIEGLLLIAIMLAIYLLPSIIAAMRSLSNGGSIFTLNLLLGWTLVFWVGALCWACSGTAKKDSVPGQVIDFSI